MTRPWRILFLLISIACWLWAWLDAGPTSFLHAVWSSFFLVIVATSVVKD